MTLVSFVANVERLPTMATVSRMVRRHPKLSGLVLVSGFALLTWLFSIGVTNYLFEQSYAKHFRYPLEVDVPKFVAQLRANRRPTLEPVYTFRHEWLLDSAQRCRDELGHPLEGVRLLFVVKSAMAHFERRTAIRQTWGWESRFSDVTVRRVFLLGVAESPDAVLQGRIDRESVKYGDLVQARFVDSYFNNTIKTMMGLNWVVKHCSKAAYVMFVDDDYYVSAKNVLRYLRRPDRYPDYLQHAVMNFDEIPKKTSGRQALSPAVENHDDDDDDDDGTNPGRSPFAQDRLFAGYRFFSHPLRLTNSKWHVTLDEYPFNMYPPYITAGAYLLSNDALHIMHYASQYTVPFRFDDVYLGIVAKKAGIEPVHNPHFYFYKLAYSRTGYAYCIASHGYHDTEELISVWNEQRTMGNA